MSAYISISLSIDDLQKWNQTDDTGLSVLQFNSIFDANRPVNQLP